MTNTDYTDNLVDTPVPVEYQLLGLKEATTGIRLYGNSDETESMSFKQNGTISTLSGKPLKFVLKFT